MHKITNNSIQNRGSNLILNKSGGVHQRNINTKFATNIGLRDGVGSTKIVNSKSKYRYRIN